MSGFSRSKTPFVNPDALDESYRPDEIQGRSEETAKVHNVLQPVIDNEPPQNAFLYGLSGLGKTATTQYELKELAKSAEDYDDIRLATIWQNCNDLGSSYQVAITLTNQLLPPNKQLPRSGLPKGQVYEAFFSQLDKLGTPNDDVRDYIVIILDEVDNIGTNDRLLYQIPRARANRRLENVWPSLIGISNDVTFRDNLSSKVKSSLCEREITFTKYVADELEAILRYRADVAFRDGAVSNEVIRLAAAYGAKEGGDARYSIDLLRNAGRIAKDNQQQEVTIGNLKTAKEDVERDRVAETLNSMGGHEHLAAAAVLNLDHHGETPARRTDIYPVYRDFAEEVLGSSSNMRSVHSYLGDLDMLGLIARETRSTAEGRYFAYEADSLNLEMLLNSLQTLDIPGVASEENNIPEEMQKMLIEQK